MNVRLGYFTNLGLVFDEFHSVVQNLIVFFYKRCLVMATNTFGQKRFNPVPPDKGSFPLDHENLCKVQMTKYMDCLHLHRDDSTVCRQQAKEYLECRMNNNLMAKEEWKSLGFQPKDNQN